MDCHSEHFPETVSLEVVSQLVNDHIIGNADFFGKNNYRFKNTGQERNRHPSTQKHTGKNGT